MARSGIRLRWLNALRGEAGGQWSFVIGRKSSARHAVRSSRETPEESREGAEYTVTRAHDLVSLGRAGEESRSLQCPRLNTMNKARIRTMTTGLSIMVPMILLIGEASAKPCQDYKVYGLIGDQYRVLGGTDGPLGCPLNDESDIPGGAGRYNQ